MSAPRGGLGRGLGALFPEATRDVHQDPRDVHQDPRDVNPDQVVVLNRAAGAAFRHIAIETVEVNPRQPREVFDEDALHELADSIRAVGLLQPVVVREHGEGRYQLVMGERRWRAAGLAGLTEIPAIVRSTPDDALLRDALLENLHREQLNPLEEAAAYRQLLTDFGATHEELATRLGRSRARVSNTVRLLNLPPTVQRRVAAGVLSAGHARALLTLSSPDAQERLAARVVAEGLSVRAVEEAVAGGAEPQEQPPRRRAGSGRHQLTDVAARLSDLLETTVRVDLGRTKGRITIEFASMEDLNRILSTIAAVSSSAVEDLGSRGEP